MKTAILLIAHGSRQPEANADLTWLADALRGKQGHDIVEPSYLELAAPTIDEAGRRCVDQGAGRVVLLPYFLSAGVHVRRDLQEHCRRLQAKFPTVKFVLAEPLGRHPLLVEIAGQRACEALQIL
jgi:sirohydrochlorin ferrochelatase